MLEEKGGAHRGGQEPAGPREKVSVGGAEKERTQTREGREGPNARTVTPGDEVGRKLPRVADGNVKRCCRRAPQCHSRVRPEG